MQFIHAAEQISYEDALTFMEQRVEGIINGTAEECVWLLEHPPLYTSGTSAKPSDLLEPQRFPIYHAGRGGEYTYHGPGQRIAYVMLDLKKLFHPTPPDLRAYIQMLERWIIATLAEFNVEGFTREGRIGVWVDKNRSLLKKENANTSVSLGPSVGNNEAKIAAIGVRVRKWVSFHGIALNVNADLSHYAGIVPCGIKEYGVTSLHDLGITVSMQEVDAALEKTSPLLRLPQEVLYDH